ncbi:MAG: hypothetical protein ACLP0J_20480 [Solirubrobacteraceae bacterium]
MSDEKAKKSKSKAKPGDSDKGKGKGKGKDKQAKGKGKGTAQTDGIFSVAANPRAGASIRRAKGWAGLAGFMIAGLLSIKASVPIVGAGERALIAGAAGYLLAWACAVTIWRQLMIAQLRVAAEEARARRAESTAAEPTITPRQ